MHATSPVEGKEVLLMTQPDFRVTLVSYPPLTGRYLYRLRSAKSRRFTTFLQANAIPFSVSNQALGVVASATTSWFASFAPSRLTIHEQLRFNAALTFLDYRAYGRKSLKREVGVCVHTMFGNQDGA